MSVIEKPDWVRVRVPLKSDLSEAMQIVKNSGVSTVCVEAACPNLGECWKKKHVTFMILGDVCTRACAFCNVKTGRPCTVDENEPINLAKAIVEMGLSHAVITSVTRDDLIDGGASQFAACVREIKNCNPNVTVEILTPDFLGKPVALQIISSHPPDVFNHNIETVPRLYRKIRPKARYFSSLNLLSRFKSENPSVFTKSGIMVGLGELQDEVMQVMEDLRAASVDFITIGQYMRPTIDHAEVVRYVSPEEFKYYKDVAYARGFKMVASGPFVRSSYHAGEDFLKLRNISTS